MWSPVLKGLLQCGRGQNFFKLFFTLLFPSKLIDISICRLSLKRIVFVHLRGRCWGPDRCGCSRFFFVLSFLNATHWRLRDSSQTRTFLSRQKIPFSDQEVKVHKDCYESALSCPKAETSRCVSLSIWGNISVFVNLLWKKSACKLKPILFDSFCCKKRRNAHHFVCVNLCDLHKGLGLKLRLSVVLHCQLLQGVKVNSVFVWKYKIEILSKFHTQPTVGVFQWSTSISRKFLVNNTAAKSGTFVEVFQAYLPFSNTRTQIYPRLLPSKERLARTSLGLSTTGCGPVGVVCGKAPNSFLLCCLSSSLSAYVMPLLLKLISTWKTRYKCSPDVPLRQENWLWRAKPDTRSMNVLFFPSARCPFLYRSRILSASLKKRNKKFMQLMNHFHFFKGWWTQHPRLGNSGNVLGVLLDFWGTFLWFVPWTLFLPFRHSARADWKSACASCSLYSPSNSEGPSKCPLDPTVLRLSYWCQYMVEQFSLSHHC